MDARSTLLAAALLFAVCGTTATLAGELDFKCDNIAERARLTGFNSPVYQGEGGWFFRSSEVVQAWPMSDRSATFLKRLDAALEHRGVQLILMPLPSKAMLARESAISAAAASHLMYDPDHAQAQFTARLATLRDLGILVVDVLGETDKAAEPDVDFFFAHDLHWRPELAMVAASATASLIAREMPGEIPADKAFVTSLRPDLAEVQRSNSQRYLNQLCTDPVPVETLDIYETLEEDRSIDAFLGDEASSAPPVALIGTSFTDERNKFNYAGFLREYLKADVATFSISGGDIDQALFKWAHTGQAASGTRVLIWEIPFLDRLEAAATALERTVVPAVAGNCIGSDAEVLSTDYALDDNAGFTATLPADVTATGDDYYIVAELADPTPRGFTMTTTYRDGKRDIFPVIRASRVGPIDTVYLELASDLPGDLDSISIRAIQGGQNSGRLALCRYPMALPDGGGNGGTDSAEFLTAGP